METEDRLTPLMIARLIGVPVGEGPERRESIEDSGDGAGGVRRPAGDPPAELEDRTGAKGSRTSPSVTVGLVAIGMLMVGVGGLLILPISLSLEHARILWGLGFFVVGISVIFSAVTRARSSGEHIPSPEEQ